MELGMECDLNVKRAKEGLGFVRYTSFGRKRIVISNDMEVDFTVATPTKKHCNHKWDLSSERSLIEALPQDILVRILCGVDQDDLKRLFHVSKPIREATLVAKQWHFAYSTPTKKLAFRNPVDFEDWGDIDEVEAPNAPKQSRVTRSRLMGKKSDEGWPRRELFMDMETENL